ncbi:tetratricopeptide repeat protein [Alicyclobacillus dauci]|uniref:Tetratricopeptide repeat protein n=1 Tax=Alicyclobacillus dauci TaxID=1475485 RepID=A0ABY6YXK3_9BACL|nr:tetratricopeptide repeat protein [Alicyclobacillus dauci]WAH35139.1 tetratricopeptide repeat protein [Alicyclobacillus dauci]
MAIERFMNSAYAYLYIGDYDEAKAAFERAIAEDPDNPEPYFHASITAHRSGFYDEARRLAERAVSLCPEYPIYRSHLGRIMASKWFEAGKRAHIAGDIRGALSLYGKALDADPLHLEAFTYVREIISIHPELKDELEEERRDTGTDDSSCHRRCERSNGA